MTFSAFQGIVRSSKWQDHDCKDMRVQYLSNSTVSLPQLSSNTKWAVCICVSVYMCVSVCFISPIYEKHDVRNVAKHFFKYGISQVNKHTFQIIRHKFQCICTPDSSLNLRNPQLMSLCFVLEQTFLLTQYRLTIIEKSK